MKTVQNAREGDAGTNSCRERNPVGSAAGEVELVVRGKNKLLHVYITLITFLFFYNVFIICNLWVQFFLVPPKVFVSGRQVSIIMGMGGVVHCRATGIPVPTSTSWFRLPNVLIGSAEADAVHQRQINSFT